MSVHNVSDCYNRVYAGLLLRSFRRIVTNSFDLSAIVDIAYPLGKLPIRGTVQKLYFR